MKDAYPRYLAVAYPMNGTLNLDRPILVDSVNVRVQQDRLLNLFMDFPPPEPTLLPAFPLTIPEKTTVGQ